MITKDSSDKEILDFIVPGSDTSVRDIGSISFMGWIISKINGLPTYQAATQELLGLAKSSPLGKIPEGEKVRLIRKLFEAGATI